MMYPAFDMNADAIISISKHMFTKDYVASLPPVQPEVIETPLPEPVLPIPMQKSIAETKRDLFTPKQENTLFWCMFIAHHGYTEYIRIGTRYTNTEIDEKQTMAEFLVKTPSMLKTTNYKLSNMSVQSLCSHLTICRRDGLFSLVAFAAYYKKHVYVVFPNKTYLAFSFQKELETTNAVILHCKTVGKHDNQIYTLDLDTTEEKVQHIRDTMLLLEHYEKPLRGASSYKVDEMSAIAKLLGISSEKKMKKTELYEAVAQHCSLEKMRL